MAEAKRGRPRSERTRAALLAAAFEELAERGYSGLTLDNVAARANAGKTTIYRWWSGKADLAVEAFFAGTIDELALPQSDNPREDFSFQITQLGRMLRSARGRVLTTMLGSGLTDPALAEAFRTKWLEPRREWGRERLETAKALGQCRTDVDTDTALALLYSPLYVPLLLTGRALGEAELDRHLAAILPYLFRV